jgi:cyanophycin synthetase
MEFRKILALRGPNIWARFPVLEAWVELGDLKDSPSNEMPGFNERIMGWLPLMIEHRCSIGERGGFFERLRRGTYLAHILEHVTLELQTRAGANVGFGRARETLKEGLFRVAIRYEEEAVCRAALEAGRQLCLAAVYDRPFDAAEEIRKLHRLADDVRMGPSTRTVVQAALARGIPVRRLNEFSLVQLGHGAKQHRIHRSATDHTGAIAESISDDKELTKAYLRSVGVPVAGGRLATNAEDAWLAAQEIGTPVVVKPKDGNYGSGVVVGISKREQIEAAYHLGVTCGSGVMVEKFVHGAEHRLLIVDGKLVAATRGDPVYVVGDGRQTVWELVESQVNSDPRRGEDLSCPLAKVEVVPSTLLVLEHEGYRLDSVPEAGKRVMIQRNGNLATDVTDAVHPEVARHAALAARVVGLDVAGVDVIADDISRPLPEQGGVVIEVNAGPGLQMHVDPGSGVPRPAGEAIVETLFPMGEDGRIPLVSVTGPTGTTAVTKLIAKILAQAGRTVGVTSAEGTFVGGVRTAAGDSRGATSARSVLLNPFVEAAVFETSLESILEEGVGFDHCQVAVITSIGEGLKLDFLEWDSPEKKSLVYRAVGDVVLPTGAVVLKAGEPLGAIVAKHCPGSLVLFSADEADVALQEHLQTGGTAVISRGGKTVVLRAGSQKIELPLGAVKDGMDAVLPAVAGAWALGLTGEQLAAGLKDINAG